MLCKCNKTPHRLVASQFYGLVATCQQVATNLSISSTFNKSVNIRFFATCHLQTCYNLLKQLAAGVWITSFDNQSATSLLTTCNRPSCEKAAASHANASRYLLDHDVINVHVFAWVNWILLLHEVSSPVHFPFALHERLFEPRNS